MKNIKLDPSKILFVTQSDSTPSNTDPKTGDEIGAKLVMNHGKIRGTKLTSNPKIYGWQTLSAKYSNMEVTWHCEYFCLRK
jgi:hypothetical protein